MASPASDLNSFRRNFIRGGVLVPVATLILVVGVNARLSLGAIIDDFESGGFTFETTDSLAGPSFHTMLDPLRVMGGDRDVWTLVHDGGGNRVLLDISDADDGVTITSASHSAAFSVMFQYDGEGKNSLLLNTNLSESPENAVLVDVKSVSAFADVDLRLVAVTNAGQPAETEASLSIQVARAGVARFPLAALESTNSLLDLSDVDSISVIATLPAGASITLAEIRTGVVPEPSSLSLAVLLSTAVLVWKSKGRRVARSIC